jgi:hypothetical protein
MVTHWAHILRISSHVSRSSGSYRRQPVIRDTSCGSHDAKRRSRDSH